MLSEVPHELSTVAYSKECKRSPQQSIPAGFPPHDNLHPGMEDSASPLTAPDMVRSGRVLLTSVKFPYHTKLSGIKTGDILPALIPLNLLFTSFSLMSTEIIAHIFQRAFFKAADLGLADMDFFRHFGLCFAFKKTHVYDMAFPLREPLHGFIQ